MTTSNPNTATKRPVAPAALPEGREAVRYSSLGKFAKKTKLKSKVSRAIIYALLICGLYYVIYSGWNILEMAILGDTTPVTIPDTLIAILLTISTFVNLSGWLEF